jgi:hypothetical protein
MILNYLTSITYKFYTGSLMLMGLIPVNQDKQTTPSADLLCQLTMILAYSLGLTHNVFVLPSSKRFAQLDIRAKWPCLPAIGVN